MPLFYQNGSIEPESPEAIRLVWIIEGDIAVGDVDPGKTS